MGGGLYNNVISNPNKLIPIWYILRKIQNCQTSTAQRTLLGAKMLNDVMLHTKLEL